MNRRCGNHRRENQPKRQEKQLIYAFYEGESEKQYLKLLKERYSDCTVIKLSPKAELFGDAVRRFQKDARFRDYVEVTDEIWFFFDTGDLDGVAKDWKTIWHHIKALCKMRRKPGIRVRLLMTTGCIEYWFMLHFQKYRPAILTKEQRDQVVRDLDEICLKEWNIHYRKGDTDILCRFFETGMENAMKYSAVYLSEMEKTGLPLLPNPMEPDQEGLNKRYEWLLSQEETFTTVQEAVSFLRFLASRSVT